MLGKAVDNEDPSSTNIGYSDEVLGSWLRPGPVIALVSFWWGGNQYMNDDL